MGVIYKITNLKNGKIYVGQTVKPVKERFQDHSYTDYPIGKAIRKHGEKIFTIEVIEECETQEELDEREIFWIKELNCKRPNGYNLTDGGKTGGGKIVSAESRKKMSEARKGKAPWNKGKKCPNISEIHTGMKASPETRKKLSESHKGHFSANKGKKASAETRAKMSVAQKKRFENPEELKKLSESHKGQIPAMKRKKHSAETRAKMSASHKAYYARIKAEREEVAAE